MTVAFILINADLGEEKEVIEEMKKISGVVECHFVYGVYDLLAKFEAANREGINETMRKIRGLRRVKSTLTMIVTE